MTSEVGSEVVGKAVEDRRGRVGQKEKNAYFLLERSRCASAPGSVR